MQKFTQKDYNTLVDSLDAALAVFRDTTSTEAKEQAALLDFVTNHYFKVWRAMAPDGPLRQPEAAKPGDSARQHLR